jgi:hypothetical protein
MNELKQTPLLNKKPPLEHNVFGNLENPFAGAR